MKATSRQSSHSIRWKTTTLRDNKVISRHRHINIILTWS